MTTNETIDSAICGDGPAAQRALATLATHADIYSRCRVFYDAPGLIKEAAFKHHPHLRGFVGEAMATLRDLTHMADVISEVLVEAYRAQKADATKEGGQ